MPGLHENDQLPSWELTGRPSKNGEFEDDFSELPVVGYEICDPFFGG